MGTEDMDKKKQYVFRQPNPQKSRNISAYNIRHYMLFASLL